LRIRIPLPFSGGVGSYRHGSRQAALRAQYEAAAAPAFAPTKGRYEMYLFAAHPGLSSRAGFGRAPGLTPQDARKAAQHFAGLVAIGRDSPWLFQRLPKPKI
jgi:hypothetical protein